jgi:hypothetical protein
MKEKGGEIMVSSERKKFWVNVLFWSILAILFFINPSFTVNSFVVFIIVWFILNTKMLKYYLLVISIFLAVFVYLLELS